MMLRSLYCGFIFLFFVTSNTFADSYIAFSLNAAQQQITKGKKDDQVVNLGGITQPVALVYDAKHRDLILVGRMFNGQKPVTIADWTVAARAVFKHHQDPAVSIDRTKNTEKTGMQQVRFQGGIEDTQFGLDMLKADVVLKRLGLGTLSAEIFGLKSYFNLSIDDWKQHHNQSAILSRFWFLPRKSESYVYARDGVAVVEEYRLGVSNEVMGSETNTTRDPLAEAFAEMLESRFSDIKGYYPELERLEQLYYITALVQGLDRAGVSGKFRGLAYWLNEFQIPVGPTDQEYRLESNSADLGGGSENLTMTISGGVRLDTLVVNLQDGVAESIKEYVVAARPRKTALLWEVPLLKLVWDMDYDLASIEEMKKNAVSKHKIGMNLLREVHPVSRTTTSPSSTRPFQITPGPLSSQGAAFRASSIPLNPRRVTRDVGGVLLEGTARVRRDNPQQKVNLSHGNFSLLLGDKDSRVYPPVFRRFVTALWAVYFGRTDPGISIDPIARGNDKQLVRYIGHVKNTDLGRVMREADYVMKKWAVGTERPHIDGFMSPDEYSAKHGELYLGAMSRFWFVPEEMTFKATDDALIFESGRMTVKTEFLRHNTRGLRADPANEAFAAFFTEQYPAIADQHPIYKELYDYAKFVNLAKYLKESGVPLFWFLMANKDLVLTEASTGTVDSVVKPSDYFEGVHIEGGVEMTAKHEYILDRSARDAIASAYKNLSASETTQSSLANRRRYIPAPIPIKIGTKNYTIAPQHSASSGTDRRGIRYQTDIAIRVEGYELSGSSLPSIQVAIHRHELWDNLRPHLKHLSDAQLQQQFDRLHAVASNKAQAMSEEVISKLSVMKDKEYQTEARFSNDLEFALGKEQLERLGDIIVAHAHYTSHVNLVRYFDPRRRDAVGEFGTGWHLLVPYRIEPYGKEKKQFLNVILPLQMRVKNQLTGKSEILVFSKDKKNKSDAAGYFPQDKNKSEYSALLLLTNGTHRLIDKIGNEFQIDGAGRTTSLRFSDDHTITIEYMDRQTNAFERVPYRIQRSNSNETVTVANVQLPQTLKIVDVHGHEELLIFDSQGTIAGYMPQDKKGSRFKMLALMTDASFRLLDKSGNEFAFDAGGRFTALVGMENEQ